MLASDDPDFKYYGYYYTYVNATRQNRWSDAEVQLANMESIRGKVSKLIVDECKIEE